MSGSDHPLERRRVRPVSKGWFLSVSGMVVGALVVASWQGMRAYGQQEQRVDTNTEKIANNFNSIDRLHELRDRDRAELNGKLDKITDTLTEQHGAISGLAVAVEALADEVQLQRRNREYRK